jgi:hypothetical protein
VAVAGDELDAEGVSSGVGVFVQAPASETVKTERAAAVEHRHRLARLGVLNAIPSSCFRGAGEYREPLPLVTAVTADDDHECPL